MNRIKQIIANLPEPKIFTELKFEEVKAQNIEIMKGLNPTWVAIESDANMMQIEAFSYKEVMLRSMFNKAIKKMLPHFSTGADLDNFAFGFYAGETRLKGEYPSASYEFFLEEVLSTDVIIPKGFELSDGYFNTSYLKENVTIVAGTLSAIGKVLLQKKVTSSSIKTETAISPYPYVLEPKSLNDFTGGSEIESDEDFFSRAILSLNKYSTAGGKDAYEYFTYLADERVFDVKILSPSPTKIDVVILALDGVSDTINNVTLALTGDSKVQAFTDVVSVRAATKKDITLNPTIHIYDLSKQVEISAAINKAFENQFKIGESLPYSSIVSKMHLAGVYKVVLTSNADIETQEDEYINILATNITFIEAAL